MDKSNLSVLIHKAQTGKHAMPRIQIPLWRTMPTRSYFFAPKAWEHNVSKAESSPIPTETAVTLMKEIAREAAASSVFPRWPAKYILIMERRFKKQNDRIVGHARCRRAFSSFHVSPEKLLIQNMLGLAWSADGSITANSSMDYEQSALDCSCTTTTIHPEERGRRKKEGETYWINNNNSA